MNIDWSPQGTIIRQSARIRALEAKLQFWQWTAIGMTVFTIVVTAMKCQH